MSQVLVEDSSENGSVKTIYILYLAGLLFGITGIIGVVMAYMNRNDAPDWLQTHYQFQIRTFWIGLLFMLIGGLLSVVLIGYFIMLFWVIWLVVRCVKGMKYLDRNEPHPNPKGWMFT